MSDTPQMYDFDQVPDTFSAPFEFRPLAGDAIQITVEWKHKTQKQFAAWLASAPGRGDAEVVSEVVAGWSGFKRPYSTEALEALFDKHPNAPLQFFRAYRAALFGGMQGN